jgi:hypothetical protein
VELALLPLLTGVALSSGNGTCLHGYLTVVKAQSFKQFELWLLEMLNSSDKASLGVEMTLRSPYSENAFNRCLDVLETEWIEPASFGVLQFGKALDSVPIEQAERLFCLIRQRETPEALQLLIGLMSSISSERPLPCGPDFAFNVARHAIPFLRHLGQSFGFNWKRVCSRLVKSNAEIAAPLLDVILATMGEEYRLSYDHDIEALSNELVSIDPEGAWQITAKHFEATLPKWRSDVYNWLKGGIRSFRQGVQRGPIANLPESSILAWIESNPDGRAALIAHAALPTLDDEGGGILTRQLLTRYGHIDGVRSGISTSFHVGSWVGPMSQHLKHKRDILRRWLAAGFDFQVAQWIETEIEQLDLGIQREEINEERDRFD